MSDPVDSDTRDSVPAGGSATRTPERRVPITSEPIRLGQFLKLAGLAEDGSHAKDLLDAEEVLVNGEVETRRGRQLADGDVVAVGPDRGRVVLS